MSNTVCLVGLEGPYGLYGWPSGFLCRLSEDDLARLVNSQFRHKSIPWITGMVASWPRRIFL
jgi:hypothetical protein